MSSANKILENPTEILKFCQNYFLWDKFWDFLVDDKIVMWEILTFSQKSKLFFLFYEKFSLEILPKIIEISIHELNMATDENEIFGIPII